MFLRLLFVLLSALNIAVGAWLLLGQPYRHVGYATDPGVPPLQLLSEVPEAEGTVSVPAAADATAGAGADLDTPLEGGRKDAPGNPVVTPLDPERIAHEATSQ